MVVQHQGTPSLQLLLPGVKVWLNSEKKIAKKKILITNLILLFAQDTEVIFLTTFILTDESRSL